MSFSTERADHRLRISKTTEIRTEVSGRSRKTTKGNFIALFARYCMFTNLERLTTFMYYTQKALVIYYISLFFLLHRNAFTSEPKPQISYATAFPRIILQFTLILRYIRKHVICYYRIIHNDVFYGEKPN